MTNTKIIYAELIKKGFTDEQLMALMAASHGDLPFHTFQEWRNLGYTVKKGEKTMFKASLWQFTTKPNMAARKRAEARGEEMNENPHFYKKSCSIFGFNQVARIDTGEPHPVFKVLSKIAKTENAFMAPVIYEKPCTALTTI